MLAVTDFLAIDRSNGCHAFQNPFESLDCAQTQVWRESSEIRATSTVPS